MIIGSGVYDIHPPNVPVSWIKQLIKNAATRLSVEHLWLSPDCGLKTSGWEESLAALAHMVKTCQELRQEFAR